MKPALPFDPDPGRRTHWTGEVLAGCVGALAVLPVVVTTGLLCYAALGAATLQVALFAAFVTAAAGSLAHAALSRSRLSVTGSTSPTALTLATFVAQLAAEPGLAPGGALDLPGVLTLCALAVLLSGVLQVAFALLGLARLSRLVPQPVLSGFMNSTALLIMLAQAPLLLGLPLGSKLSLSTLSAGHPWALALGLGTAGTVWLLTRRWPRLPVLLLALLAGTVVHQALLALFGTAAAGALIGMPPSVWPWPHVLAPLFTPAGGALLLGHAGSLAATALALAAIGALESSLNARAMDQALGSRHDPDRELVALGCGNMVCGLLGGLPLAVTRTRALATLQAGGRGRLSMVTGPLALGLLYVLGGGLLAMLPLPVLAGIMLVVAWGLADRWSGRLLARWRAGDPTRDLKLSLLMMALVVGMTMWRGMASGVGLGVLLSLVAFAVRMNRGLVQARYRASARPSRRSYPAPVEARLRPLRDAIEVFEIEGAVFFGSGERLLDEADTLGADCRWLVLDLRRVSAIDESGAMALQQAVGRAHRRGIAVELAGLADTSAPAQVLRSFAPGLPQWPDADRAIEAAEQSLLGDRNVHAMDAVPLAAASLLAGLDAAQVAVVAAHLQEHRLAAGEVLFAEGDPGDRLYVVSCGSISILSAPDAQGRTQRYLSVSPGMMIGETAMLDGGGRSAGAVADADTLVHALTQRSLDAIGREHPDVAIRLYRNIALHLAQRLRGAAGAWRAGGLAGAEAR
jgi:MFS superfamily sulfate permease-like transporter